MTLLAHTGVVDHLALGVVAALAVAVYGAGWLRRPGVPGRSLVCWIAGLAAVLVATSPWMESVAGRTFAGHMVQHLLLIVVAAPLLVIAEPVRTVGFAWHVPMTATGRRVAAGWRRAGPFLALAAFTVVLFTTHLSPIYDDALSNRLLHDAEHVAYLAAAVALWAVVCATGRASAPARIAAAFGVIAVSALLGLILMAAREPLMPTYTARLGAERAVSDQRAAASIMWVGGMISTLPLVIVAFWRWASTEDRIARRAEALSDRPRPVDRGEAPAA